MALLALLGDSGGVSAQRHSPQRFGGSSAVRTYRTLLDLTHFEVHGEKPAMNLPALGVSDLWRAPLPPIMKKKIIFDGDDR